MKFLASILALLAPLAALHAADARKPNILFIVSDDQRPDTIHALGNAVIHTPNLDRLTAQGTSFSRAYSGYPICQVSRAQMLTGTHAFRALAKYPAGEIDPKLATLARTFQAAGYHTVFTGKWHNDGHPTQRGYATTSALFSSGGSGGNQKQPETDARGRPLTGYRGWTFKDDQNKPELEKGVGLQADNSRHIADGAIRVLRTAPKDQPWLLHVNFAFPHDPRQWPANKENSYLASQIPLPANFAAQHPFDHGNLHGRDELLLPTPRTAEAVREELALYYAMITDLDEQLGRILNALPSIDDTLIIFTSDQGLALGSHGLLGKQNQYEHTIRSPLIISGPGLPINARSTALVTLYDLFPTLCDLSGLTIPATVTGRSLAPLLRRKTERIHEFIIGSYTDTQRMICDERWKYVNYPKAGRQQLFDLQQDPHELHDLSDDVAHRPTLQRLQSLLRTWLRQNGDVP